MSLVEYISVFLLKINKKLSDEERKYSTDLLMALIIVNYHNYYELHKYDVNGNLDLITMEYKILYRKIIGYEHNLNDIRENIEELLLKMSNTQISDTKNKTKVFVFEDYNKIRNASAQELMQILNIYYTVFDNILYNCERSKFIDINVRAEYLALYNSIKSRLIKIIDL